MHQRRLLLPHLLLWLLWLRLIAWLRVWLLIPTAVLLLLTVLHRSAVLLLRLDKLLLRLDFAFRLQQVAELVILRLLLELRLRLVHRYLLNRDLERPTVSVVQDLILRLRQRLLELRLLKLLELLWLLVLRLLKLLLKLRLLELRLLLIVRLRLKLLVLNRVLSHRLLLHRSRSSSRFEARRNILGSTDGQA